MSALKPYPAYKDSGVDWLQGETLPTHWPQAKLSYIARFQSGDAISGEEIHAHGQYPVHGGGGLRGYASVFNVVGQYPLIGRQGALCGKVWSATGNFYATEHAIVAYPSTGISATWLEYILGAMDLGQYSTSAAQPGISVQAVASKAVPVPPEQEQRAIADFLDRETAEIDAFVAQSEKLITLLNERRAAVITQAVTKGLDPSAPLKDTGIEWLGQIPAHWELEAVRSVVSDENHKNQLGQDAFYLSLVAGRGVMPYAEKGDIGNKMPEDLSRCKVVARGDLVINSMNYGIGSYGVSKFDGVCSPVYIVLRPKPSMDIRYVERIFECRPFQRLAQSFGNGILEHRRAINWDTLKSLRVPVPPAEEQKQIEESIRLRTAKIDEAIATAREAIALAKERRQALISAAVTGKIDVRNAA